MSDSDNWQASLLEQRMAWGIAASCIMLVLLASSRPEWFDFSTPQPKQAAKQTAAAHPAAQLRKTPVKKIHTKPHAIHPKQTTTAHAKTKTKSTQTPVPVKKSPPISSGFYVQLGAFQERPRAQGLADQIKRKGWRVVITTKKDGLHAVWVGPRKTRSEAEKLLNAIYLKLKNKGFIIHQKQA